MSNLKFRGFHHVKFYSGNAKQSATFYTTRLGMTRCFYRGLETSSRQEAAHVLKQDKIYFVLCSDLQEQSEITEHVALHGDGVKDVAFCVDDCQAVFDRAVSKGAKVVREPWTESDEHGTVKMATIATVILTYSSMEILFTPLWN